MIDVRIDDLWHMDAMGIWIMDCGERTTRVAKPIQLVFGDEHPDAFMLPEPTLTIPRKQTREMFQAMVNQFVRHGFTPNTDKTAGLLEAQTKHLEDMRSLVFKRGDT